jgi:hypothetical protein
MPIELGFILQRLAAMADKDEALRDRQPWKAAYTRDYHWLGEVITKHYAGDDSDVKVLLGGILQAFAGMESRSTRPPPTPSSTPASTRPRPRLLPVVGLGGLGAAQELRRSHTARVAGASGRGQQVGGGRGARR